jgi:hypothetical protein
VDVDEIDNNSGLIDHNNNFAYSGNHEVDEDTRASEEEIIKAGEHVKMARAQRALVNEKMEQQAKADRRNKVWLCDRTYTLLIVDYGQNMALPYFGELQPGDT